MTAGRRSDAFDRDRRGSGAGVTAKGGSGGPHASRRHRRWIPVVIVVTLASDPAATPALSRVVDRPNVLPLVMKTPHSGFNRMVVSVTVCASGTERCATIDDVMVDTGSTGLRLEASVVPPWLRLPPVPGPGGRPLAECLRFVHDTAWGSLHLADVRLGGLSAKALPIQVIDDLGGPQPAACPRSDTRPTSNGTLGVGQHPFDCQGGCEQRADAPAVFARDAVAWTPVLGTVEPRYRLPNPVSYLPRGYDNGVVIDLPSPGDGGTSEVVGTLTFGVGTAADETGTAAAGTRTPGILRLDAAGRFTTVFGGRSYKSSYVDSGTETYVLQDDDLPRCRDLAWAYCAEPRRTLGADLVGTDGARTPVSFAVGDYRSRRERRDGASDDMAEAADPRSTTFVWGAPFFLGRRISLVMDGKGLDGAPGLIGPFYAIR